MRDLATNPNNADRDQRSIAYTRWVIETLNIPGLSDIHVHFMPDNVMEKVWNYFDKEGPLVARKWPIRYKATTQNRLQLLSKLGVVEFPSLCYPHKAKMAEWLNDWCTDFAVRHPNVVHSATFFPEIGVVDYVTKSLTEGCRVFKAHIQVGRYDPRDPLLQEVWELIELSQLPVITHCGSGPIPGPFTGITPIREVLGNFPKLKIVVAHMGSPQYEEFLQLATDFANVHLDTTMTFTPFTEATDPFPYKLVPRLRELEDKIILGTDFPNIPYEYDIQIRSLFNLGLGEEWLAKVLWYNGHRIISKG